MAIYTYVTNAEITEFLIGVLNDATFVYTDIPIIIRGDPDNSIAGSAFDYVNQRADYVFDDPVGASKTYLLNGDGSPNLFSPEAPILTITECVIIARDDTEEDITLVNPDKQLFWDSDTGLITLTPNGEVYYGIEYGSTYYTLSVFPAGLENVRIVGTFGINAPPIIKLLQMLVMFKQLQFQQPHKYKVAGNLVREQIGRYEYQLGVIGFDSSSKTASLDTYIDMLFDQLPKINTYAYEAI